MKPKKVYQKPILTVLVIFAAILITGCAVKKNLWGDPKTGLILKYRMGDSQILKYRTLSEFTQSMEVMGQSFEVISDGGQSFTVKFAGMKEDNYKFGITIDTMYMKIVSPQGEIIPDMSDVIGKSFDMSLTTLGKEFDFAGAEKIKYSLGQSGERSIATEFKAVFPDLPERPVKLGDKWTTTDTITEKSDNGNLQIIINNTNTLEGFEKIKGKECVKITADFKGALNGKGMEQGAELITTGEITGKDTWYFAYKEGVFVKIVTEGIAKNTTTVPAQNMEIPSTREYTMETELIW
ncbi:MAG: hypothetical protein H8D45_13185 [Bacteroidetes bacterium]|nr:hypothetical protein [Bacteroidota bacterium]MBL7105206.1 hypothetical protein [Bacteroidales bacterium]